MRRRLLATVASALRRPPADATAPAVDLLHQLRAVSTAKLPERVGAHTSSPGQHPWAAVLYTAGGLALYGAAAAQSPAHADAEPLSKLTAVGIAPPPPETPGAPEPAPQDRYARPKALRGLPKEVILYQYEVCPFCNKARAVLDYYKIPYRAVEVNPLTKAELKWGPHRHVPVALLDQEVLADSSAIVSRLAAEAEAAEAAQQPGRKGWFGRDSAPLAAPQPSPASLEEEERWRRWVDDRFVRVITINIYRNGRESFQTFDYIAETGKFSWPEQQAARVVGALMMWALSGRLKKKYKVIGDPREELYADAEHWVAALGDRPFMGGEAPNLADLSVFGVVRSITGTDTFMDLLHNTSISKWYERMMKAVGDSARLS